MKGQRCHMNDGNSSPVRPAMELAVRQTWDILPRWSAFYRLLKQQRGRFAGAAR